MTAYFANVKDAFRGSRPSSAKGYHVQLSVRRSVIGLVNNEMLQEAYANDVSEYLTPIASKSCCVSLIDAPFTSGAAGKPIYLAIPDKIETSMV